MTRRLHFALLFFAGIALLASTSSVGAQAPEVLKVEPPGWWAGHSINPVRVLIRGRNLSNARLEIRGDGLRAGAVKFNATGTYLLVDVEISRLAKPGNRQLRITTGRGSADANFEILNPLARAGRFQGFSTDDVIYLIMT